MNRIVLWSVCACCCLVFTTAALAQENVLQPRSGDGTASRRSSSKTPIAVGVDVGMNYSFFSQDLSAVLQTLPALKVFESGSGIAPLFNVYVDIGVHRSVGIQLKMGYDAKTFGNKATNTENCAVAGGPDIIATINNEYTTSPAFIALGVLARIDLTESLIGTIGPVVHFTSGKPKQKVTRTIQTPDNCYFDTGTRTRHAEGELAGATSPRFGMEFGLGYKVPLTPSITLVPKAGFQFFFSKAFDESQLENGQMSTTNSQLHSAQFSIGLLFGL